jgi:hypothetical protein
MSWHGPYYYRSRREGGCVVSEYVGAGRIAELAAQMDALGREQQEADRAGFRARRAELDALDAPLDEMHNLAELVARAALVAAGFHQYKRGEWRKRRVQRKEAG